MVNPNQDNSAPELYAQSLHKIKIKQIDPHAKEIIDSLNKSGFKAYLVGGCIRDLVLKRILKILNG